MSWHFSLLGRGPGTWRHLHRRKQHFLSLNNRQCLSKVALKSPDLAVTLWPWEWYHVYVYNELWRWKNLFFPRINIISDTRITCFKLNIKYLWNLNPLTILSLRSEFSRIFCPYSTIPPIVYSQCIARSPAVMMLDFEIGIILSYMKINLKKLRHFKVEGWQILYINPACPGLFERAVVYWSWWEKIWGYQGYRAI